MPPMTSPSTHRGTDMALAAVAAAVAALALALALGAEAAALLLGAHHAVPFDPFAALLALGHLGDPALAWPLPARQALPGAAGYWSTSVLVLLLLAAALATPATHVARRPRRRDRAGGEDAVLAEMGTRPARRQAARLRSGAPARRQAGVRHEGVLLGRIGRSPVLGSWEDSLLVLGPPRSGKTTALVAPAVAEAPGAVLATSTRPDLLRSTLARRRAVGPVVAFDPHGLAGGGCQPLRWSPVLGAEDPATALRRGAAMAGAVGAAGMRDGDFWVGAGADLLALALHAAALAGAGPEQLLAWVSSPSALHVPAHVLASSPAASPGWAQRLEAWARNPAAATTGSVCATASRALAAFAHPEVLRSASRPSPDDDLAALLAAGATIHLLARAADAALLAPLVAAIATDLLASARHAAAQRPDGRLDPPLLVALDEAANVAPLPDVPSLLATAGGEGVVVLVVLQSLEQARSRWGAASAGALLDAATVTLVLPGLSSGQDLRDLAALAGEREEREVSRTTSASGESTTTGTTRRPVLRPEDVRQLPRGEALLLARRLPPARIRLVPLAERREPRS